MHKHFSFKYIRECDIFSKEGNGVVVIVGRLLYDIFISSNKDPFSPGGTDVRNEKHPDRFCQLLQPIHFLPCQWWRGPVSRDFPCVGESVHEHQWQPVLTVQAGNAVSKETVRHLKHLHRNSFQSMTGWISLAGPEEDTLCECAQARLSMSLIASV